MEIKDLLTTYWSQVTLMLFAVGFLLKRILDNKSKKIEINHSLFQQNRLIAVKLFFSKYAKAELMWHQIAIYEILNRKIPTKEIDKIIFPYLNELEETLLELKIYFDSNDHKYFEDLTKGLLSINEKLLSIYFDSDPEKNLVKKSNEYSFYKDEILTRNKAIMDKLCLTVKKTFES
ncbi:MAG: hypothetical protein IPJ16_02220 [Bacteroidales bacterium]|nr:hypothetical protein [Bacteroidales bacterium]